MITQLDCNVGGDNIERYTVGFKKVTRILEYKPAGEGDKFYYDVYHDSGQRIRCFYPVRVWINNQITGGENS